MDNPTYPSDERRRSARHRPAKSSTRVACQRGELFLGPDLAESLVDASEEGFGILAREALSAGERVSVSLDGIGIGTVRRLGRVTWCESADGGLFRAGVELDAPLAYAELMALTSI